MKFAYFLLLLLLVVPVSAGTYLHQGEEVYYGDRVDLTGVYGWRCTVAHWDPGTNDLQPPSQIRDVCSFAENIEITPDRFPVGRWYKWEGEIHGAENDLAFKVMGYRPTPTVAVVNITTVVVPIPPSVLPTAIEAPQQTPEVVKTTPTSVISSAQDVFLPTAAPPGTPQPFVKPTLPPIPIIIVLLIVGGLLIYWFLKGDL